MDAGYQEMRRDLSGELLKRIKSSSPLSFSIWLWSFLLPWVMADLARTQERLWAEVATAE
jgi:hypothetical protein